ncbi:NADAR family protein [Echinimonas agarilytica]|uniref:NADAR family protein n=1 Tax=Echinimonas agarilytica TaxID=1215918 RepID=A0AA41W5F0_9GAMM|nr:NADAR family protein [Echinimonas agarilytica]MCM2679053.1 NADAR family protein [Echinimonas agarilytica]
MFFVHDDSELDLYLSRTDHAEPLSAYSAYPFELEGKTWPTVEHYFQAMKYDNEAEQERIRQSETPELAAKLGSRWFKPKRKDWKSVQVVIMTRGVYIKARTHPDIAEKLLATDDQKIVENSSYDFYWGCGRDRRGENQYGQVLMNVRAKLKEEQS